MWGSCPLSKSGMGLVLSPAPPPVLRVLSPVQVTPSFPNGDGREKFLQDSVPLGTPALKAWVAGGLGAISLTPPVGPQGSPRLALRDFL